ncbi:hypothetical protein C0Q93_08160 [Streptomyces albidoflavus]|nr:hypothetical protein C0Q93_08160 [Streptomyces albidoflavus]RZE47852.1 hypothetical protein C0Q94_08165 [Streptomyces albidoflavus]
MRGGFAALGRAPGVRCNPGLPPGRGGVGWPQTPAGLGGLKRRPGLVGLRRQPGCDGAEVAPRPPVTDGLNRRPGY